jgi:hypothetical protein
MYIYRGTSGETPQQTVSPDARTSPRHRGADERTMSLAAVLDAATDDTLLAIAIALPTSADLLHTSFSAFPYVCPEPFLAKGPFSRSM